MAQMNAFQIFTTMKSMSLTVTSYAMAVNATWPFVTIDHYRERGDQLLFLSGAAFVAMAPYVEPDDLSKWETWSVANQGWMPKEAFPPTMEDGISPVVWKRGGLPEQPVYAPLWQISPITPMFINLDVYNPKVYQTLHETRELTMSSLVLETAAGPTDFDNEATWPLGMISAPVFKDFEEDSPLVGQYSSSFQLSQLFKNILPDGVNGMFVVVQNTCNETVTYQLNGPKVQYLGEGDLHDKSFEYAGFESDFHVFADICEYTLRAYPSEEIAELYETNKPIVYTIVVVLVFAATSMFFILYDCLVQRRQETVMTSALKTNAIVSSLFPPQFRDRLMEGPNGKNTAKLEQGEDLLGPTHLLPGPISLSSKPIAELFLNCTVMFGGTLTDFGFWKLLPIVTSVVLPPYTHTNSHIPLVHPNRHCWIHRLVIYKRATPSMLANF